DRPPVRGGPTIRHVIVQQPDRRRPRAACGRRSDNPVSREIPAHEHTVRIGHVLAERWTLDEAVPRVQTPRRCEEVLRTRLEVDALVATGAALLDQMRQHEGADATPAVAGGGP